MSDCIATCPSTHFLRARYMSHRPYDTQPRHCALPVFGWRGTGLVLLPCRLASACCSSCGVACAACLRQCVNGFRHIVLGQEVRCARIIATVIWKPSATEIQLQLLCAHYASYFLVVSSYSNIMSERVLKVKNAYVFRVGMSVVHVLGI